MVTVAVTSTGGYAFHLRDTAAQRTELIGRLRGAIPDYAAEERGGHEHGRQHQHSDGPAHARIDLVEHEAGKVSRCDRGHLQREADA
mgnify:CR=1 FL=1